MTPRHARSIQPEGALADADPARLHGMAPLVNAHTRVLVLGSFPGVASLAAQQYYGHPRNHFWPIMAGVFEEISASVAFFDSVYCYQKSNFAVPQDYAERCAWLLAHGVGLWDVYASCERQGSLDAAIRHAVVNDFAHILAVCPNLQLIAHNGGESFKHARHTQALGVPVVKLPSSSPANASWSFERKKAAWVAALMAVLGPDRSVSA